MHLQPVTDLTFRRYFHDALVYFVRRKMRCQVIYSDKPTEGRCVCSLHLFFLDSWKCNICSARHHLSWLEYNLELISLANSFQIHQHACHPPTAVVILALNTLPLSGPSGPQPSPVPRLSCIWCHVSVLSRVSPQGPLHHLLTLRGDWGAWGCWTS